MTQKMDGCIMREHMLEGGNISRGLHFDKLLSLEVGSCCSGSWNTEMIIWASISCTKVSVERGCYFISYKFSA